MAEIRHFVVVGVSWAGLSAAHFFLKHIFPTLKQLATTATYRVVLIDPSSHFFWHIGAPRACVSTTEIPHSKSFTPILDCFKQYDTADVVFYQAEATGVDFTKRTLTMILTGSGLHEETIPFYSLVLSMGVKTPTPLTSLHGDHNLTLDALDDMNERLRTATDVVISGGGPVAVEVAGEIGTHLNGIKCQGNPRVSITIVTASSKLLPVLRQSLADKAEKLLKRVGVTVIYNTKVRKIDFTGEGFSTGYKSAPKTSILLDNGQTLIADVFIPATGVMPNAHFLPKTVLDENGYIITNPATLRVDGAGPRVYCIGDVGNYSRGGILDLYKAVPVLGTNMSHDLGVYSDARAVDVHRHGVPNEKAQVETSEISGVNGVSSQNKTNNRGTMVAVKHGDKIFKEDRSETQVVPIGRKKGVGAFKGWRMPSMAVYFIKGKDYRINTRFEVTHGTKWEKA